ncbi:hypothetical protein [Peribacillus glennii]|uniref:Yip1 domain-containing protein n=1 Tax=Peribacillus glennii TaxID=2303991 RepID=A0A372L750_9BACI|nr:hypothetical protein [Peribacillus glennii]RFU60663.1 hypothetical protein D0466_21055 [Peribacillus glennii]
MTYRVQLLNGVFFPGESKYRLKQAEEVVGFGLKLLLLYVVSIFIFGISAYFGIGSESISREVTELNGAAFETKKLLIVIGELAAGILFPCVFLFLASLFFWTLIDTEYMRIVIIQMFAMAVALFEKALSIPFFVLLDINQDSNPFSLGVLSQQVMSNEFFVHFFGEITIFQLAAICLQYYYLKDLSEVNKYLILSAIILVYLVAWLVQAFLSYITVSVFF